LQELRANSHARWIWPTTRPQPNTYAVARRTFPLPAEPKRAKIIITAETRYRLFVNGQPVCRGPARGYPEHQPYDEIDIAPYLRKGSNVLAALVHYWGCDSMQNVNCFRAGLLIAGQIACRNGKTVDISTGPDWRMRMEDCYAPTPTA